MSDENQDPATNAQQDLLRRMEELASQMVAPPSEAPSGATAAAAPADDGGQDMMRRMAELAAEMSAPAPAPVPAVAAPAPVPTPQPAPPEAAPEPVAAAPDPSSLRALRTLAEMVRELKASLQQLQGSFSLDSAAVSDALKKLAARPAPFPAVAAPAPISGEILEALRELKDTVAAREPAAAPAPAPDPIPAVKALALSVRELKESLSADKAPPPSNASPALEALSKSMLELKAMMSHQLEARDQRIAELEARLEMQRAPVPAPAPLGFSPAPGLDDLADSVRDMQAAMERFRETMKADLAAAITGLKYNVAGQISRLAAAPRAEPPAAGIPSNLFPQVVSAVPPSPTFDVLRQELLGPMAAMKAQLLDLTMSYHQLSLRLAILAAQEKTSGPGMLE